MDRPLRLSRPSSRARWGFAAVAGILALGVSVGPAAAKTEPAGVRTGPTPAIAALATVPKLTFSFSAGWTTAQKTPILSFLAKAYPLMVDLYGPPSHSNTVVITADLSLNGWAFTDPPAPWPNPNGTIKIRINPKDTATWALRLHYLTHEVLHAFHGFDFMPTSSLEEGETESAASLLRPSIAKALGIAWSVPAEPEGSALISYDGENTNVLGGRYWYGPSAYWPQQTELYATATSVFWTLHLRTATLYKQLNAWWYARFDINELWTTAASAINSKLAALVPAIGPWSYATWRSKQFVLAQSHAAGYHLSCQDATPEVYQSSLGFGDPDQLVGEVVVVRGLSAGDDVEYSGTVHALLYNPAGSVIVDKKLPATSLHYYWLQSVTSALPGKLANGAYRLVVRRATTTGEVTIGACRFVEGWAGSGRLMVIGTPGTSVTATHQYKNPTTHVVSTRTSTKTVGPSRLAVFSDVTTGLAIVGLSGSAPTKVIGVGTRGAVVSVIAP